MKLKAVIFALRSNAPPTEVSLLERFSDGGSKEFNSFLRRLRKSQVRQVSIRTGFLIDLSEEQTISFFDTLASMTHLDELRIQSSSRYHVQLIPVQAMRALKKALRLQTLILEDLQVTALHKDFISALASVVEDHPALKTVAMRNFFANDYANTGPNILDPLLWTLATAPALETLELSGCGSYALTGQSVTLLSPAALSKLFTAEKLTNLELSFLELEFPHFQTVAKQLRINQTLTDLTLDYHKLERQGFQEIMHAMEKNFTIKALSLRSLSDVADEGFAQAMQMLQHNYVVERLAVTTAVPNQQAEIDLYLRMNGAGRSLLREPNTSLSQWMEVLAKNSDDLDVTRHLLQEIPGICNLNVVALQA
jgi:hypothetical protein